MWHSGPTARPSLNAASTLRGHREKMNPTRCEICLLRRQSTHLVLLGSSFIWHKPGVPSPGTRPLGELSRRRASPAAGSSCGKVGSGPLGRGWLMSSIGTRPADVNSRLPEPITNWTHGPEASEARCLGTTAVRCPPGAGPGAETSPHGRKCQPCAEIRSFRRKSLRSERGLWLPAPRAVLKPRYGNKDTTVFLMLLVEIRPRTTRDSLSCLNCRDTDAFNKERAFPGLCS